MTLEFTGIERGVELDNEAVVIPLVGVPGGGDSDVVGVGSLGLSDNGNIYRKATAGTGADKWQVLESGTMTRWREPALVKDDTGYANLAAAELSMNLGTVDGVAVTEGDRILYTNITGENQNVYTITGTVGAGATLVEDGTPTLNDVVRIDDGTFALRGFYYDGSTWVDLNSGDYTSNQNVTDGQTFEEAISALDARSNVQSVSLANTGGVPVTVESLLVDDFLAASYIVRIKETATQDTTLFDTVLTHDGDGSNDATAVNRIARRIRGLGAVGGAAITVALSGTGVSQQVDVQVVANADFDVHVMRYAYVRA